MRKPCGLALGAVHAARHVEALERGVGLRRDLGLGLPDEALLRHVRRRRRSGPRRRRRARSAAPARRRSRPRRAGARGRRAAGRAAARRRAPGCGGRRLRARTRVAAGSSAKVSSTRLGEEGRRPVVGEADRRGLGHRCASCITPVARAPSPRACHAGASAVKPDRPAGGMPLLHPRASPAAVPSTPAETVETTGDPPRRPAVTRRCDKRSRSSQVSDPGLPLDAAPALSYLCCRASFQCPDHGKAPSSASSATRT